MRFTHVNENSVLLTIEEPSTLESTCRLGRLAKKLNEYFRGALIDVTPSYSSILFEYRISEIDLDQFYTLATDLWDNLGESKKQSEQVLELPVYYHEEVAPDLVELAAALSLEPDELIRIHSGRSYLVCAIGFAPGFGFLGELDERIRYPRRETPRQQVVAGSVGIAGKQTGIYPLDSPGGWQIIGNCPTPLFSVSNPTVLPFRVGDYIRFRPIGREEFFTIKGEV